MKSLFHILLSILVSLLSCSNLNAQTCNLDFGVTTTSTNSVCLANGTITATITNPTTNVDAIDFVLTNSNGVSTVKQSSNVFSGLASGTYTLTATAHCLTDYTKTKDVVVSGIVVGGSYSQPIVSFNSTASRKSYTYGGCNTGIIALNVTGGSRNYTFDLTVGPWGATKGVITPSKKGDVYTFPSENYPPGDYTVVVDDGCFKTTCTFTIDQLTTFPSLPNSSTLLSPTYIDNDCGYINVNVGLTSGTGNADWDRFLKDGMYEVGLSLGAGTVPTNWITWSTDNLIGGKFLQLDVTPNDIEDYIGKNATVAIRVKGCDYAISKKTTTGIKPSASPQYGLMDCDAFNVQVISDTEFGDLLCYPIKVEVVKDSDGQLVYTNPSFSHGDPSSKMRFGYDDTYTATITSKDDYSFTTKIPVPERKLSLQVNLECDHFIWTVTAPEKNNCWPIAYTVTDATGKEYAKGELDADKKSVALNLPFDIECTINYSYPNMIPVYSNSEKKKVAEQNPTTFTIEMNASSGCAENMSQMTVGGSPGQFPTGTVITVTGPSGFDTFVYTMTESKSYFFIPKTDKPIIEGLYTITAEYGCGIAPVTKDIYVIGAYKSDNVKLETKEDCSGLKLCMNGKITFQGIDLGTAPYTDMGTYFKIVNGPTGYDQSVKGTGDCFVLSESGTYTIGIQIKSTRDYCTIREEKFVYEKKPLGLNTDNTSAYMCSNGVDGFIIIEALNGVAPYTYELYNANNTTAEAIAPITGSGVAVFKYGQKDQTYTVRITDACGTSFTHKVTMQSLKMGNIASGTPFVCSGGEIKLESANLGDTDYKWTGPNGYESHEKDPTILNADPSMSGVYELEIWSPHCNEILYDKITIKVYDPVEEDKISDDQTVCVRLTPSSIESEFVGGAGNYTYQWQKSNDNGITWIDVVGATQKACIPSSEVKSGIYQYRLEVTDECGVFYSTPVNINVEGCSIPVNPNLRSKSYK